MFIDILIAFISALLLNMFSSKLKLFIIIVSCTTILIALAYGARFAGTMDLSSWLLFVILFDKLLCLAADKLVKILTKK
jgi:hypothetical protein